MQVDPRLERLTALIEQKRAQQQLGTQGRVIGRPGNPKFAEAARRVQLAREGRPYKSQPTDNQQNTVSTLSHLAALRATSKTQPSSVIDRVSTQDRLTEVRRSGHLYTEGEPRPLKQAAPHLGHNFDTYA